MWLKALLCDLGITVWKWIQVNFTFFLVIKSHQKDICNENLSSTCSKKFLGIKIDNKLSFEEHIEGLRKKASEKFSAVARISSLMESAKLRALRAHVSTCLACLRAHVPACLACLPAHVPTCLMCLRAHVITCLACFSYLRAHVL